MEGLIMDDIRIRKIFQKDERTLGVEWTDGRASSFDVVELRRSCPCAVCIDEWTHKRLLKPEDVPESIRPIRIESVGRYAMNIKFSDGHGTGIYTFKMLRDKDASADPFETVL